MQPLARPVFAAGGVSEAAASCSAALSRCGFGCVFFHRLRFSTGFGCSTGTGSISILFVRRQTRRIEDGAARIPGTHFFSRPFRRLGRQRLGRRRRHIRFVAIARLRHQRNGCKIHPGNAFCPSESRPGRIITPGTRPAQWFLLNGSETYSPPVSPRVHHFHDMCRVERTTHQHGIFWFSIRHRGLQEP